MYIFKRKIYFKRRNLFSTARLLNVGACKEVKVYYMNQKLTFNFFPEQMIDWKVACLLNDEKKTWIYAPRQHTNMPEFCIMNW